MIVCHCCALTDRQVSEAFSKGHTAKSLVQLCKASHKCGGCLPELDRLERMAKEAKTGVVSVEALHG